MSCCWVFPSCKHITQPNKYFAQFAKKNLNAKYLTRYNQLQWRFLSGVFRNSEAFASEFREKNSWRKVFFYEANSSEFLENVFSVLLVVNDFMNFVIITIIHKHYCACSTEETFLTKICKRLCLKSSKWVLLIYMELVLFIHYVGVE